MDGFKTLAKGVKCFKEGGSVYKSRHSEKSEEKSDMAQDKKIVKKAFAMHDKQEHPGEKTNLSKLKKGGRSKKTVGTVKKYACGGGVFGAKKTKEDIKNMDAAKDCKPKKLAGGGDVMNAVKSAGKTLYENVMGTPEKNATAQKSMDKQAQAGSKLAKMLGGKTKDEVKNMPDVDSIPTRKKGGKVKKMMTGGTCS